MIVSSLKSYFLGFVKDFRLAYTRVIAGMEKKSYVGNTKAGGAGEEIPDYFIPEAETNPLTDSIRRDSKLNDLDTKLNEKTIPIIRPPSVLANDANRFFYEQKEPKRYPPSRPRNFALEEEEKFLAQKNRATQFASQTESQLPDYLRATATGHELVRPVKEPHSRYVDTPEQKKEIQRRIDEIQWLNEMPLKARRGEDEKRMAFLTHEFLNPNHLLRPLFLEGPIHVREFVVDKLDTKFHFYLLSDIHLPLGSCQNLAAGDSKHAISIYDFILLARASLPRDQAHDVFLETNAVSKSEKRLLGIPDHYLSYFINRTDNCFQVDKSLCQWNPEEIRFHYADLRRFFFSDTEIHEASIYDLLRDQIESIPSYTNFQQWLNDWHSR